MLPRESKSPLRLRVGRSGAANQQETTGASALNLQVVQDSG